MPIGKGYSGSAMSLSRGDGSRYIKLVLIGLVNIHSLVVSNGRSFRLEGGVRRQGVSGIKWKDEEPLTIFTTLCACN